MAEQPSEKRDYIAVIAVGVAGAWARDEDKDQVVKRVARIFRHDFRQFYKLTKGAEITINVIDVTGYTSVCWDESGFYVGTDIETGKRIDRKIERVVHTY